MPGVSRGAGACNLLSQSSGKEVNIMMTPERHQEIRDELIKLMRADHADWNEARIEEELLQTALGRGGYVEALGAILMRP